MAEPAGHQQLPLAPEPVEPCRICQQQGRHTPVPKGRKWCAAHHPATTPIPF